MDTPTPAAPFADHDMDDDVPCFRHPQRLTALRCISCDRPICTDCAIAAPVGIKCSECAHQSRSALGKVPRHKLVRATGAGLVVGTATGIVHHAFHLPFLSLILAWGLGRVVGAAVRAAAGGYRDRSVTIIAASTAGAGFGVAYSSALFTLHPQLVIWSLLYAAVAIVGAIQQSNG